MMYNVEYIKQLRTSNGYTMNYVADSMKVSLRHYDRLEKGHTPLNANHIESMIKLYPTMELNELFNYNLK